MAVEVAEVQVQTRTTHDVFISFAGSDKAVAISIAERLRRVGISVWSFLDQPESGSWHLNQVRALRHSKLAIFVITPASDASPACLDEAQRVADPGQTDTVPLPVVVGAWNHVDSDLWLLLSKWNGVIASPQLGEESFHRLLDIVHDKLGLRPTAALSTGQALVAVKDDLCDFLDAHQETTDAVVLRKAHELQVQHRGKMVDFAQFTYLDRELEAAQLITDPVAHSGYVSAYLRAFFDRVVADSHRDVATRLSRHLTLGDTIVVSEYSRVILQAFKVLSESDRRILNSLRVLLVSRTGMLLVDDEPSRMRDELTALGLRPETIAFGAWINFLLNGVDEAGIGEVDTILFGVEAFSEAGDVVYPQIVKELDGLIHRRDSGFLASEAKVIVAGESYKVCRRRSEVSKMIADPHYTVIPAGVIDLIVTDIDEYRSAPALKVSLRPCIRSTEQKADRIRDELWPAEPLPAWNAPVSVLRAARVVASDIDGTLTTAEGVIGLATLRAIGSLEAAGRVVLLVTGRSAGWSAGLARYLPSIAGVLAENGAVLLPADGTEVSPQILDDGASARMSAVHDCIAAARERYPALRTGADNAFRLTDQTVEVDGEIDPSVMAAIAAEHGCGFTYSSVHYHFSASVLDKQSGLIRALPALGLDDVDPKTSVVTIGDSFNDQKLFDRAAFALTFGVRDVLESLDALGPHFPNFVTLGSGGLGFTEFAELVLAGD